VGIGGFPVAFWWVSVGFPWVIVTWFAVCFQLDGGFRGEKQCFCVGQRGSKMRSGWFKWLGQEAHVVREVFI
jgi:hypothetical protein